MTTPTNITDLCIAVEEAFEREGILARACLSTHATGFRDYDGVGVFAADGDTCARAMEVARSVVGSSVVKEVGPHGPDFCGRVWVTKVGRPAPEQAIRGLLAVASYSCGD